MKKRHFLRVAAMLLSLTLLLIPSTAYGKANGYTWPRRDQYINFYIPANSNMISAEERNEIVAAFRTWREVNNTNNYFWHLSFMTTTNSSAGPNNIYRTAHFPFGSGNAGYTYFHDTNGIINSVDIYLNDQKSFSIGASPGKHDYRSIIIHEAGHALGVAHCHELGESCRSSTCNLNAMNRSSKIGSIQGRTLQEYDKASYMAIYFKTSSEVSASRVIDPNYSVERQRIYKEALIQ